MMNSKDLKAMIDDHFCTSDTHTAHPIRVARKTINGKVYRLFQMHGVLAGAMAYGLVEVVEYDGYVTDMVMYKRTGSGFQTVREKYNKMGSSFVE